LCIYCSAWKVGFVSGIAQTNFCACGRKIHMYCAFRSDTKLCLYSLLVTFLKHEYSFRAVTIISN
jgi:hypothetical protein